jgi:hypothetical protein
MFLAPGGAAPSAGGSATAARARERRASIEDDFEVFVGRDSSGTLGFALVYSHASGV